MAVPAHVVVGAAAVSMASVTLWWTVAGDRRLSRRAAANLRTGLTAGTDVRSRALASPASERVALPALRRMVAAVTRLVPAARGTKLSQRITAAGMSARWPVDAVVAAKLLLGAAGVVCGLALMSAGHPVLTFYGVVVPVVLFFGPDLILRAKARERQRRIRLALPDTLDQLTVCVEAGLGFESAMARAARSGAGPFSEELVRTLQDIQLGVPRAEAVRGLSVRNDVAELRQFVQAIVQAEGHGVPIARVLRLQAAELREKRRQAAEERAMKISIKMLFPLVVCILPTVFIVIIGPAIFQLVEGLGGAGR